MPSEPRRKQRSLKAGFSLLEVLVALALAAGFLAVVLSILPMQSRWVQERLDRLLATELAYSLLEEYRMTYPQMEALGQSGDWSWQISERDAVPEMPELLAGMIRYVEITATVRRSSAREGGVSLSTLVARRAP